MKEKLEERWVPIAGGNSSSRSSSSSSIADVLDSVITFEDDSASVSSCITVEEADRMLSFDESEAAGIGVDVGVGQSSSRSSSPGAKRSIFNGYWTNSHTTITSSHISSHISSHEPEDCYYLSPPSPRSVCDITNWENLAMPPSLLKASTAPVPIAEASPTHSSDQTPYEAEINHNQNLDSMNLSPRPPMMPKIWSIQSCMDATTEGSSEPSHSSSLSWWQKVFPSPRSAEEVPIQRLTRGLSEKGQLQTTSSHSLRSCLRNGRFSDSLRSNGLCRQETQQDLKDQSIHNSFESFNSSVRFSTSVEIRRYQTPEEVYAAEGWSQWFACN